MNYLVSGATGFIGRQLCRRLSAPGCNVTALSRCGGKLEDGLASISIDLTSTMPDAGLFRDVDVFFHLAGIAHQKAEAPAYESLNHQATLQLAQLASEAGVRCFVYLSSVKAMGPPSGSGARTENDLAPPTDPYGLSKRNAEISLMEAFSQGPMSVVIIRPALVYGAAVKGNLRQLAKAVRWGLPRPPEAGCRSMIALDDLVELLCVVAENPPGGVQTWIASGDREYSTRAVYDLLRKSLGMVQGKNWLPSVIWHAAARMLDIVSQEERGATYNRLFGAETYSNAAVLAATAWRPRQSLEDVIGQIAGAEGDNR